ncbi:unnamed protein product [Caenorhabditis brenneri]
MIEVPTQVTRNTAFKILKDWDDKSKKQIEKEMEEYENASGYDRIQIDKHMSHGCQYFTETDVWKNDKKDAGSYRICCELVDYCSFYYQNWFYWTCGGVFLFFLLCCVLISCCCCCGGGGRGGGGGGGRGGGGKDTKEIEELTEED